MRKLYLNVNMDQLKRFSGALIGLTGVLAAVAFSCNSISDNCGGGNYFCTNLISTLPYIGPIRSVANFDRKTLFADGSLVVERTVYENSESRVAVSVYDLNSICSADTICDLPFVNAGRAGQDTFLAALTPDRLCIVRNYSDVVLEIGNIGPDSTRLHFAICAELDSADNFYIVDSGDSTVKVFGPYGDFIRRFKGGIDPYQLKTYEDRSLFILDRADDGIREYTLSGDPTGRMLKSNNLSEITAFDIFNGVFMVADMDGQRLTAISLGGDIIESKLNYCYNGFSFDFEKIVNISSDRWIMQITDMGKALLIDFRNKLYDETHLRYR